MFKNLKFEINISLIYFRMDWNLVAITYNVNKQRPTQADIQTWLESQNVEMAEIVTFAMQEIPNGEIMKATQTHNTWSEQLTFWMNARNYTLVNKLCLASNMLLIYLRSNLLNHIERIDDRWCRSTLFGAIGFKGTISSRIEFRNGVVLIFITSHFFADEKFNRERINQYRRSLECTFPVDRSQRKHIIWQGDLNFRVEGFANSGQFISILNRLDNIDELAKLVNAYDQLQKAKQMGEIFADFVEAPIRFKPTYRILVGSGRYDPLRIPSWCDRILYKTSAQSELNLQRYSSIRQITASDHFPVLAHFKFTYPPLSTVSIGWPCTFEPIPQWEELIPIVCRLNIPKQFWTEFGSNLDWIGVYCTERPDMISRPLFWVYLLTCPYDEQRRLIAEFQPLEAGIYRIGYYCTKKKCLQALSNPFSVRKRRKEEEEEEKDVKIT